jgi:hypothetical protein
MTKRQMEIKLTECIKKGTCWNDVAFEFVTWVLEEHLGIDSNSIDPAIPFLQEKLKNPLIPGKLWKYNGKRKTQGLKRCWQAK